MFFKKLIGAKKTVDVTIVVKTALVSVLRNDPKQYLAPLVREKRLLVIDSETLEDELHVFRVALWYLFYFQFVGRRLTSHEIGMRFGAALTVAIEETQGALKGANENSSSLLERAFSYIQDALSLQDTATLKAEMTFFLCQILTQRVLKDVSMANPLRQPRHDQVFEVAKYVLRETEKIQQEFQESYDLVVS